MNAEMTCGGCADPANHPHAIDCQAEARMAELSAQLRAGQITYDEWDAAVNLPNRLRRRAAMERADWVPTFSRWRHGGWYVDNIVFPSGAVGCIASPTADRGTFVSACFVDAYEGRKTRAGAALAERAEAIRQWAEWDAEQAASQPEQLPMSEWAESRRHLMTPQTVAANNALHEADVAAAASAPLVPITAAQVADDAMRAFTVTDGDVEECSAQFIREQIEEAVEAGWAHRAAEAEAKAAEVLALLREARELGLTFHPGNAYIRAEYIEKQRDLRARIAELEARA